MRKKEIEDPVEVTGALKQEETSEEEFDSLDVSKIKVEVLPDDAARAVHPFDGYPVRKIKISVPKYTEGGKQVTDREGKKVMEMKPFNITDIVLHNHYRDPIHQDPSNRRNKTYHGRSIKDVLGGNSVPNVAIQFATPIKTANGTYYGAFVPDPYIRCQLAFTVTTGKNGGRVIVDKRYMLLDPEQKRRLKQCFERLLKPQQDMEKVADQLMAGEEPAVMKEVEYGAAEL